MAMPPFVQSSETNQDVNYFSAGLRVGAEVTVASGANYNITAREVQANGWRNPGSGYGQGVILGSEITYRINPCAGGISYNDTGYPIATTGTFTPAVNITSSEVGSTVNLFSNTQQDRACQMIQMATGEPAILFDVPRCVGMYVTFDAAATSVQSITAQLTGLDMYGQPLVANVTGTAKLGTGANAEAYQAPIFYTPSAFSMITQPPLILSASNLTSGGCSVQFCAANVFGLPYLLQEVGHMNAYSQWSTYLDQVAVNPTGGGSGWVLQPAGNDLAQEKSKWKFYSWSKTAGVPPLGTTSYSEIPIEPFLFNPTFATDGVTVLAQNWGLVAGLSEATTPTATTIDVRGLFSPNTQFLPSATIDTGTAVITTQFTQGDSYAFDGPITIRYYTPGADIFQNVQKNVLQTYATQYLPVSGTWQGFGKSNLGVVVDNISSNPTDIPLIQYGLGVVPYSGG